MTDSILVRVHSQCLTGDAFGSLRCDCGEQLKQALTRIQAEGKGILLYISQEGRGIGLAHKMRAYALQDDGLDTVEANQKLGFKADEREFGTGAQILHDLGVRKLRVLTNNPKKLSALRGYGLEVVAQLNLTIKPNPHNQKYLETKQKKLGHLLSNSVARPWCAMPRRPPARRSPGSRQSRDRDHICRMEISSDRARN